MGHRRQGDASDPAVQTLAEEVANGITHGIGAALSVAGLVLLLIIAASTDRTRTIAAVAVYGGSLLLVYLTSTLYHSIRHHRIKAVFNLLDHAAIFLLIAGTYTPFALLNMQGWPAWGVLGGIWLLALCGIVFKLVSRHRYARQAVIFYLAMGWIGLILGDRLISGSAALWLILGGGIAYTAGVAFYLWERLPFNHAIWHLFVLKGSALHFLAVLVTLRAVA